MTADTIVAVVVVEEVATVVVVAEIVEATGKTVATSATRAVILLAIASTVNAATSAMELVTFLVTARNLATLAAAVVVVAVEEAEDLEGQLVTIVTRRVILLETALKPQLEDLVEVVVVENATLVANQDILLGTAPSKRMMNEGKAPQYLTSKMEHEDELCRFCYVRTLNLSTIS